MKKLVRLVLFAMLSVMLLTACKQEEVVNENPQEENEEVETFKFAYSCLTMDNPFFISLENHLRTAIEEAGHTLITLDAASDAELQNEQILELVEQDVDAVFVSPVDWIEITPAIQALKDAGIKVINIDTQVQAFDLVDAYVGSDNTSAGYVCGKDMEQNTVTVGPNEALFSKTLRANDWNWFPFAELTKPLRVKAKARYRQAEQPATVYPEENGFARIDAKGDLDVALPEVEEVLKNNPDIVAIMCGNDPMALGALVAANTVGNKDVLIYGIDGSPEVKKELVKENSLVVATVAQSTEKMANEAAAVALKILNGESYERAIYIETVLIDKENIAEYEVDKWQ